MRCPVTIWRKRICISLLIYSLVNSAKANTIVSLVYLPDLCLAFKRMLCARTNETGFSGCPHLPHHYTAMTPSYAVSPLVAVGCVVCLELCTCKLARKHDSAGWVTDCWFPSSIWNSWACSSVKRQVLVQTFLISPTDFHEIYRNFLIFEVCRPLDNLVEAGQLI